MTIRDQKRLLWAINAALAAALVTSALLLTLLPLGVNMQAPSDGTTGRLISSTVGQTLPLREFAVIYERDLRKPLFDAPPARPIEAPPPKLAARLIGTAVEPGFTYGLFKGKDGQTHLVEVGQKIDGAEVLQIAEGTATVLFEGERLQLKVEAEP